MTLKIVIQTDADFTPAGKRSARVVQTNRGSQLRWYVSGRVYRRLPPTAENLVLTSRWIEAGEKATDS